MRLQDRADIEPSPFKALCFEALSGGKAFQVPAFPLPWTTFVAHRFFIDSLLQMMVGTTVEVSS
jgi:hypothetical protein